MPVRIAPWLLLGALSACGANDDAPSASPAATGGDGGMSSAGTASGTSGAAGSTASSGGAAGSAGKAGTGGGGAAGSTAIVDDDPSARPSVAGYVDPLIGTLNYANTFPGAVVPWGMASPSPHNQTGWVPAGYRYNAGDVYAFGNSHISGAGCPDLGGVWVMPYTGDVPTDPMAAATPGTGEQASAGYYSLSLTKYAVLAEMTATKRTALYRFTFPERDGDAEIVMDAARNQSSGSSGTIEVVSPTELQGQNHSGQFCYGKWNEDNPVYFFARFSKAASASGTIGAGGLSSETSQSGGSAGAYFRYSTNADESIEVRIGLSYVSSDNARENLEKEAADLTFDDAKQQAFDAWDLMLKRIIVEGGSEDDKTIFYTALYHALLEPNVASDTNGDHAVMEKLGESKNSDRTEYSVYSLWDTYRNVHPLLTLVYPEVQADMVESMVSMARDSGYFPKWELDRNESMVMVGDPATIVIADSYLKGVTDFDVTTAYDTMLAQATTENPLRPGILDYIEYGYIPDDNPSRNYLPTVPPFLWGSVSTTLEYALADWHIAELAQALGKDEDAKTFHERAKAYQNFYDASTGFLRPKNADGSFREPFDPLAKSDPEVWEGSGGPGFVEGNAWQYRFFVPHDVPGLIELMGGPDAFVAMLQDTFDQDQFDLTNEPDMAFPYLFTYADGEAYRTQQLVREALSQNFKTGPEGIPGNDDTGALSSFYLFGAMGFYPDNPGSLRYSLGSPVFDKVTIHLSDGGLYQGGAFSIVAHDNDAEHVFVASAKLNGADHPAPFLTHQEIVSGGSLELEMSSTH